jgi:hypothetical protein
MCSIVAGSVEAARAHLGPIRVPRRNVMRECWPAIAESHAWSEGLSDLLMDLECAQLEWEPRAPALAHRLRRLEGTCRPRGAVGPVAARISS